MSDDKFYASEISHSAEDAEQKLLAILKTAGLQAKCYAYKTRVKSWKKLLSKVEIKKEKKSKYCLSDITDVLGLRIVTLFRQDMIDIIDIILSLVSHQLPYNPIPFEKNGLKEAIIYSPSLNNDLIISQAKQKIQSFYILPEDKIKMESSAARYSSIHLVAYMDSHVPDFDVNYQIPVEIQIRTVFEDAWGELDHKYGYQNREGKSEEVIKNPIHVQKNLLTMKKFVDSCSEYADNIRDLATESSVETNTVNLLDTDELITNNLRAEGVSQQYISEYMKVREIRASAQNSKNKSQTYLNAAENFTQLLEQSISNTPIQGEAGFSTYYYYIKMDEALCRLSTADTSETEKALTIYKDLAKIYLAYPVVQFRMGQALVQLKEFEEARKQLKKCRKTVERLSKVQEEKRAVRLPNIELDRIKIRVHLLLGFAYWQEANDIYATNSDSIRVYSFIEQAYKQTESALEVEGISPSQNLKIINNMIFYALEIVHFKKINTNQAKYDSFIKQNISTLEENIDINTTKEIHNLDTLMNCYVYLDNKPKSTLVAGRLEKLSLELNLSGGNIDNNILKRVSAVLNEEVG
jgi:ppGpp synthetase/RelA/SpoT-type nucleotidyltranferase